jgi:hypothetical protein
MRDIPGGEIIMHLKPIAVSVALAVAGAAAVHAAPSHVDAASKVITVKGNGYTLFTSARQMGYGLTVQGSLLHNGVRYKMLGDWIPAGDAGGDLLRFYEKPFNGVHGLVSVATLYNECVPNCAASRTYLLGTLGQWTLPGSQKKAVKIVQQP